MSAAHPLQPFLYPKGVAIIGASASPLKHGGRRWLSALAANGGAQVFPVNVRGGLLNERAVAKDVRDLPKGIDLAVVLVPALSVPDVLEQCAAHEISRAVIVSGGFGETGNEGLKLERKLVSAFRARGGRILGPNCAGLFSAYGGVNVLGWDVPKGNIGVITQSGNVALTLARYARKKRTGFSTVIPLGNAADVRLSELVELLISDDNTHSILIYCEGFSIGDGRRLVDIARSGRKRIVMLKPGRSEAGRRAVLSHTASVAGDEVVVDGALRDAGIVRAEEIEEAIDIALAFTIDRTLVGKDIAVLSDGGGHATIVADFAGKVGLGLSSLLPETVAALRTSLPPLCGVGNPIDFAGTAEPNPRLIVRALRLCADDPGVSGLIFSGLFGGYHLLTRDEAVAEAEVEVAKEIVALSRACSKPILIHTEHADSDLRTLRPFRQGSYPLYETLESAAKAMRALLDESQPKESISRHHSTGIGEVTPFSKAQLLEPEARRRLRDFGLMVPHWEVVSSRAEALAACSKIGGPVAMKLISRLALHKSDVGGVVLDVDSALLCTSAFDQLHGLGRKLGDADALVMVAAMQKGVEVFIGAKHDPYFGPVVAFGSGGVLVELVRDVVCRLAPLDEHGARQLIDSTRVSKILNGYRGSTTLNMRALVQLIVGVSELVARDSGISELDLNPVIVNEQGASVVDVRWMQQGSA